VHPLASGLAMLAAVAAGGGLMVLLVLPRRVE
jgi:hypothetical protein